MTERGIDILMYHSLSEGNGPTRIAPAIFRQQMQALEDCGYHVASLAAVADWLNGEAELPKRTAVLTFDDGFEDFARAAFPELQKRSWTATVFLPAGKMDGRADWESFDPQRLMNWTVVAQLAKEGIDFGGHGVTHANLATLPHEQAHAEIVECKRMIEERAGCPVTSFAAPFGKTTAALRRLIGQNYSVSVGTSLARAGRGADLFDLPRIEMWYFREPSRWRAYLEGRGEAHFLFRRSLRSAGGFLRSWALTARTQEKTCQPT